MSNKAHNTHPLELFSVILPVDEPSDLLIRKIEDFGDLIEAHLNYTIKSVFHVHGVELGIFNLVGPTDKREVILGFGSLPDFSDKRSDEQVIAFLKDFSKNLERYVREGTPVRKDDTQNIEGTDKFNEFFTENVFFEVTAEANLLISRWKITGDQMTFLYSNPETVAEALEEFTEPDAMEESTVIARLMEAHQSEIRRIERAHFKVLNAAEERYSLHMGILMDRNDEITAQRDSVRKLLGLKKIRD